MQAKHLLGLMSELKGHTSCPGNKRARNLLGVRWYSPKCTLQRRIKSVSGWKWAVQCSANKHLANRANIIVCPNPRTYMRTHTPEKRTRKWFSPLFVRPPQPPPPPPRPSTLNKQPQCSVLCHLKDDVNIIGYICKRRCQGQWRHLTWRTNFFSTCVSIINEQLLKWIRCPRVASILAPLPLPCKS